MNTSVDNVEILSYKHEIERLERLVAIRDARLAELENACKSALSYVDKLDYLCSTLTEEHVDLNVACGAIQSALSAV